MAVKIPPPLDRPQARLPVQPYLVARSWYLSQDVPPQTDCPDVDLAGADTWGQPAQPQLPRIEHARPTATIHARRRADIAHTIIAPDGILRTVCARRASSARRRGCGRPLEKTRSIPRHHPRKQRQSGATRQA